MMRRPSSKGPGRSGFWCILAGIVVAAAGGVLCLKHLSMVGPLLMLMGLAVFGLGLLLEVRSSPAPTRKE